MTYNFDPERWYDNERRALDEALEDGRIGKREYQKRLSDLDRRHEKMIDRLDGTYQLPD
ncbi:hypothetical protein D3OALGA1CA_3466 [Olavius algarvensis associated proteobacterium Delta 3]|nr:hypothetical protein D3OALGB2SA_3836 [Olavius algarvensis associated proteobacterium Delta 3]CAB5134806.1 hypothetical protein D3OALGA1CA_3466 [Olavius algarvensis associated proteobacterium Delta 3]